MAGIAKTTASKEVVGQGKKEKESNLSELAKTVLSALEQVYDKMRNKLEENNESESIVSSLNKMFYYWDRLINKELSPEEKKHVAEKLMELSIKNSIILTEVRAKATEDAPDRKSSNIVQNFMGRLNVLTKSASNDAKEVLGEV